VPSTIIAIGSLVALPSIEAHGDGVVAAEEE
jgi:hypothetical protein